MIHYNEATNISDILAHFRVSIEDLQKVLNESLSKGGDYADLFFEHTINHNIALRDGEVNRASSNVDYGVGVRVVVGDQTGYAYVENTTLEDMLRAARTAAGIAKMSHHDNSLKI